MLEKISLLNVSNQLFRSISCFKHTEIGELPKSTSESHHHSHSHNHNTPDPDLHNTPQRSRSHPRSTHPAHHTRVPAHHSNFVLHTISPLILRAANPLLWLSPWKLRDGGIKSPKGVRRALRRGCREDRECGRNDQRGCGFQHRGLGVLWLLWLCRLCGLLADAKGLKDNLKVKTKVTYGIFVERFDSERVFSPQGL